MILYDVECIESGDMHVVMVLSILLDIDHVE